MTTTVQSRNSAGWVRQSHGWAGTTPGWLRVTTVVVVVLAAVAGTVGGLALVSRAHAVGIARQTAEPLVVDAQTAVVELSGANTTVAGGFLSGPVLPVAAQAGFENDLAQAITSLTAASQRAGVGSRVTGYLQTIDTDLPVYAGIVATAEADNRQGDPVGAAYLAEANHLMEAGILPAASSLYGAEQAGLAGDDRRAITSAPVIALVIVLIILLCTLVYLQVGLVRRFRRLLNPGCLVATFAGLTLVAWLVLAVSAEGSAISQANQRGTNPLQVLTHTRILASEARADDELTLVTRDSDPTYQRSFKSADVQLLAQLGPGPSSWTTAESQADQAGADIWQSYDLAHNRVRADDNAGDLSEAVTVDQLESSPDAASVDTALADGVDSAVASFATSANAARSDLSDLI